ncbi:MAG: hypothetical protein IPO40_24710 [Fibrobacteres bacterium]|nr:hypothetical protein [Fibrobacterota bacterium]
MASRDDLDPLGTDWKSRGDRGTAILREVAIEEAAGKQIPVEPLRRILTELAGSVCGCLQSIQDRVRGLGVSEDIVEAVGDIVSDCRIQISAGLDAAHEEALGAVDAIESIADDEPEPSALDGVRGPVERKKQTNKGKPTTGNMKSKGGRR